MGLRINNNLEAFNAHRNLVTSAGKLSKSMEKLSSGLRINRAADDAAGLVISETMRAQIKGLEQAQRNAQDGISLVQTAEGAMQEMHSILHRVRELAVQYQNGVYGDAAQFAITTEVGQLSAEVGRMIEAANFNGIALLSGGGTVDLQVGPNGATSDALTVSLADVAGSIGNALSAFAAASPAPNIQDIDDAIDALAIDRANFGAVANRLEYTVNSLGVYQENLMAAESRIRDVDMAKEMTNLTKMQILQQSGTAMLSQANMLSSGVLSLLG